MHPHKHVYCHDGWNIFLFYFFLFTPRSNGPETCFFFIPHRVQSTRIDRWKRSMESVPLSLSCFSTRDNLANVGTSERKLTGNAHIEQQQQEEFSSSLETREERKKNSSDRMLLAPLAPIVY